MKPFLNCLEVTDEKLSPFFREFTAISGLTNENYICVQLQWMSLTKNQKSVLTKSAQIVLLPMKTKKVEHAILHTLVNAALGK